MVDGLSSMAADGVSIVGVVVDEGGEYLVVDGVR